MKYKYHIWVTHVWVNPGDEKERRDTVQATKEGEWLCPFAPSRGMWLDGYLVDCVRLETANPNLIQIDFQSLYQTFSTEELKKKFEGWKLYGRQGPL